MKLFQKKNNKGFSLVELIVVVAIMAVLMGILVPTLIKNVEKSKRQKDLSALEEIRSAMTTELASETYSDLDATFTFAAGDEINLKGYSTNTAFANLVAEDVEAVTLGSKVYKACSVTFSVANQKVTCTLSDGTNTYDLADIDYSVAELATK